MRVLLAFALALAPSVQAQDAPVVLGGQVVDADGAPVVGAELKVSTRSVPGWTDVTGLTDVEGRFRLRFPPPAGYVLLDLTAPGLERFQKSWRDLETGQRIDLEVITLQAGGVLIGRIVNAGGERITGAWRISARGSGPSQSAELDPETGEFRIEGLPTTTVEVSAHLGRLSSAQATVDVQPGVEHFVELTYNGPDPGRRITVELNLGTVPFQLATEHVHLLNAAGLRRDVSSNELFYGFVFDDLDPGVYQVVIDDPRFERWTQEGVRPGSFVDPQLVGAAAIVIEVVDAETGEAIPRFGLEVLYEDSFQSGRGIQLVAPGKSAPPDGRVAGIVASPCELVLHAPGRPEVRVELRELAPGEDTPVRIEIPRAMRLVGRVLDSDGQPERGVKIEWTPGSEHGHTGGGSMSVNGRTIPNVKEVLDVDLQGRFELTEAGPGVHALRVRWSPWLVKDLEVKLPADPDEPLAIERPPHGWLEGALEVPFGIDPSQVVLSVSDPRDPFGGRSLYMLSRGGANPEGFEILGDRYRLGPLPPGSFEVVAAPAGPSAGRRMSSGSRGGNALAEVRIKAGETLVQDLDLRAIFPGDLDVHVHVGGDPLAGPSVTLLAGGSAGNAQHGTLNSRGDGIFRGVIAGRYSVQLESEAEGWSYDHPVGVSIEPAEGTSMVIEVPLATHNVRFEDEGGDPIADTRVTWACGRGLASGTTDAAGHLNLTLVAGSVSFGRGGRVTVDATWSAGTQVLVVVLPGED